MPDTAPPRRRFQFGLSSLLWLMLVVAMAVVIGMQHSELSTYRKKERQQREFAEYLKAAGLPFNSAAQQTSANP